MPSQDGTPSFGMIADPTESSFAFRLHRRIAMLRPQVKSLLCVLTLLALSIGPGMIQAADQAEPLYKGKCLSEWIAALKDQKAQLEAVDALSEIGEKAVPALIDAMKDPKLRGGAVWTLDRLGPKA